MPRSLVSFWKRVATSGPTVDGREILPQELRDIGGDAAGGDTFPERNKGTGHGR